MTTPPDSPQPAAGDDSLTQHVEEGGRRSGRLRRALLGLGLVAVAGVAAAYGWQLFERARALEAENRDLSDALELHRASAEELDAELEACEEDLTSERVERVERHRSEIELEACQNQLDELEAEQAEVSARLGEFEELSSRFRGMIDTGQLDVVFRRGEMIVELPAAILFPSGSDDIADAGREALEDVADILAEMPDRRFTVAGHTDNVPVGDAPFENNWDLSASRAVAVTEELVEQGIPAENLVAAGYSEHAPVASNRSARGRHQNRRIEIILEPELDPALKEAAAPPEEGE